ncbi:hypothetical protein BH11PSE3_BH11PSE3_23770 [soil metagenome]
MALTAPLSKVVEVSAFILPCLRPHRLADWAALLAFGDAGSLVLPLLFSAAVGLTGGYATGFLIGGALALALGLWGLWWRTARR